MMTAILILWPNLSGVTFALSVLVIACAGLTPSRSWYRRHLTRDGRTLAKRLKACEAK